MALKTMALAAVAVLAVCLSPHPLRSQQRGHYPAFTLLTQTSDYDAGGNETPFASATLYVSPGGGWRSVMTYSGGQVLELVFVPGKGVFRVDHADRRMVLQGGPATGQPHLNTHAGLSSDPRFIRTESVMGLLCYVHRWENLGYVYEMYFAPELGSFPLKRVTYHDQYKWVDEPISLTLGAPEEEQVDAPDYPFDEQRAVFDKLLESRLLENSPPEYPAGAKARGLSGTVVVQVEVDESGRVKSVGVVTPIPQLWQAAVDAAYRARFRPKLIGGRPVRVTGLLRYVFPPEALSNNGRHPTAK